MTFPELRDYLISEYEDEINKDMSDIDSNVWRISGLLIASTLDTYEAFQITMQKMRERNFATSRYADVETERRYHELSYSELERVFEVLKVGYVIAGVADSNTTLKAEAIRKYEEIIGEDNSPEVSI